MNTLLFLASFLFQLPTFVDFGTFKVAHAGVKACYFYSSVPGYSVQVVCTGPGGRELNAVNYPGTRMIGGNDDDSVTWVIERNRTFRIAVGGVENRGSF